jgi:hypothetical protein
MKDNYWKRGKGTSAKRAFPGHSMTYEKPRNVATTIIQRNSDSSAKNRQMRSPSSMAWYGRSSLCIVCGSDYMKFAVDGCCQSCQQRAEFSKRERGKVVGS